MPRVSRSQAAQHKEAITEASARLFRERGIDGVSVVELMGAAGLTHGGFYGHFASKDELAAVACEATFVRSADRWKRRVLDAGEAVSARTAIVDAYLSPQSRNQPGSACPTSSLVSDVARTAPDSAIRSAFACGVERLVQVLAALQDVEDCKTGISGRERALADLATMAGALSLARATAGSALSDEFLDAGRNRLRSPASPRKTRAADGGKR